MIQMLLQKAWKYLCGALPDLNAAALMDKAAQIGAQQGTPAAVMGMLEGFARSNGFGAAFDGNQIWQAFKHKKPDEIIPHAQKTLQSMGKFDLLASFLMKR